MKAPLHLDKSSTGRFIVYLVWEQAPKFISIRNVCSSREIADINKIVIEKEWTSAKKHLIFIEPCEIDHLHGTIEMHNLVQIMQQKEENLSRALTQDLKQCKIDYAKAVTRIRTLERILKRYKKEADHDELQSV